MKLLPYAPPNRANPLSFAGKHRLLIADDELVNRRMHTKFAERFNAEHATDQFEIETAVNGQEALDKLELAQQEGKPFSVLITDNSMPQKTGLELITALKPFSIKPFIAMISSDPVEEEARARGASAFHTKPARRETIRDILMQYQGTLTCPIPASKPMLEDLPQKTPEQEVHTTLPTMSNPFDRAFAKAAPWKPQEGPLEESLTEDLESIELAITNKKTSKIGNPDSKQPVIAKRAKRRHSVAGNKD